MMHKATDGRGMKIPIYVINMEKDVERLASISANLASLGLVFERVPAVLGADHMDDPRKVDLQRYLKRNRRNKPRNGELGCYLSHLRAYEQLLKSDQPWCVILEDDAEGLPELSGVLDELGRRDDWDLAKLFCFHGGTPVTVGRLAGGQRLCVHLSRTTSTAGYAINRRAAETLLRKLLPMSTQIDHAMDRPWETGLRIRGVRPLPVRLAPLSAVTTLGKKDKKPARTSNPGLLLWRGSTEVSRFVHGIVESARSLLR
jgi:glycosyl transferase family 25